MRLSVTFIIILSLIVLTATANAGFKLVPRATIETKIAYICEKEVVDAGLTLEEFVSKGEVLLEADAIQVGGILIPLYFTITVGRMVKNVGFVFDAFPKKAQYRMSIVEKTIESVVDKNGEYRSPDYSKLPLIVITRSNEECSLCR